MIRRLLQTRILRERVLLAAFAWAFVCLWGLLLARCASTSSAEYSAAAAAAEMNDAILERQDSIENRLEQARAAIDPTKTIGPIKLSSTVDALARNAGLTADIAAPANKRSNIFTTSTVRVSVRGATLDQLIGFTQAVRGKAPYLAIRGFRLSADTRDQTKLNAEIEIESFELNQTLSR
jgi:hypothetical protein